MGIFYTRSSAGSLLRSRLMLLVLACLLAYPRGASAQDDKAQAPKDFDERLAKLDNLLEARRIKNHIPGMAIAIVKDDEVVFAKGYGHRDLEEKKPVETDTLFAIGSSTKSFTGTLVAMLVDQGKMQWDDPVTKFIPDFKLDIDTGHQQITIRDLLCHRTGFTRMGILWAGGALSREEVVKRASTAKPFADFQEKFLYNNVMFMAAGISAGRAAESDWDSLIAEKIFKPLGMNDSSTTIRVAQKDPRLALGYTWDKDKEEFKQLPMRNIDSIAPSGSINSNVNDMSQYLRFQLSKGRFKDQQLLSEKQHAETWKKQMEIGGGVSYGFGWMLKDWNGKQVVEHGGNIDGFGAQVSLLPEWSTGYVLLTNVTATPLQAESINLVFDTLFADATENKGLEGIDTASLVGKYAANFGPFNNETFEVLMKEGKLAIDVPGQTTYELKAPDDEGKWYFALTNQIAVSFNRNKDDKVISITMHQAGMTPEFIREDVELPPEMPLTETAPLVGKYRDEKGKTDVQVDIRKGRLVVAVGNRGTFGFLPPDEDGKWAMRAKPDAMQIRFNQNEDGTIRSLSRFQGDKETEMPRISKATVSKVPRLEELLGKIRRGYGSIDETDFAGVRMKGSGNFIHQGATGTVDFIFATSGGGHATRQDFGELATTVEAFDGERGFTDTSIGLYEELSGRKLNRLRLDHPLWILDDWKKYYTEASITGESEIDGQQTFEISLSGDEVLDRKLYVGVDSGLILKEKSVLPIDPIGEIPIEITYSDYRDVGGVQLPFKTVTKNPFNGEFEVQFESAEPLLELPKDAFVVPPPVASIHEGK